MTPSSFNLSDFSVHLLLLLSSWTPLASAACNCGRGTCRPNNTCQCPTGYTGLKCEVAYPSCENQEPCQHGKCLIGLIDSFGNSQHYCSCDSGFVGEYCEHAIVEDGGQACTAENQAQFCSNGGACNPLYPYVQPF